MSIRKIDISEIRGFRLGNAEDKVKGTGCTVIICEEGGVGGVDVRGGAPATRETDLLRSENTVSSVNAVVLSGGSAFGLEAASGVMRELSKREMGFRIGNITVPIVCGASLFDLGVGVPDAFPDVRMGEDAVRNAYRGGFKNGNNGAGTGATVGKLFNYKRAMKTGLGTYACGDGFLQVGAVVAVNAVGDIYSGAGNIIAGLRSEHGDSISGTINALKGMIYEGAEDDDDDDNNNENHGKDRNAAVRDKRPEPSAKPDRPADKRPARKKVDPQYSGIVRAMEAELRRTSELEAREIEERISASEQRERFQTGAGPSAGASPEDLYLSMFDRDSAAQSAAAPAEPQRPAPDAAGANAAAASADPGAADDPIAFEYDSVRRSSAMKENEDYTMPDDPAQEGGDPELGYDIPFNTTIGCLITNAKLTKAQANKLASMLHDSYARAIKPVHSTLDGDTIFVLTTGKQSVNFDAFAALAADVMQYAIIDGALSARGAYGLPSARDI